MPCTTALGLEQEYLTALVGPASRGAKGEALNALFRSLQALAPSLPSSSGCFHPYGRVYLDCGHLEYATSECDSPYTLADTYIRGERLLSAAVRSASRNAPELLLVANNHDGVLRPAAPTWGSHENYLVEVHPSKWAAQILPFLISRVYAGAGALCYPSGDYHAGVRPLFMQEVTGGGTTCKRAIHSLAREEHHMGPAPTAFRYHLLVGDAHRMRFNMALQTGATVLAVKAILHDEGLSRLLRRVPQPRASAAWLQVLRELNHYAVPGQPPRAAPLAVALQRVYLDGARRFVEAQREPPLWMARCLHDWERTLDALEQDDREWLSARLDAFAKYDLFDAYLESRGVGWERLRSERSLFGELALLEQDYARLDRADSTFGSLAEGGLIDPGECVSLEPGDESDPFLTHVGTRADARARFLYEHHARGDLEMGWAYVRCATDGRYRPLFDPFAREYGAWVEPR